MSEKFKKFAWVRMTKEFTKIYPYNRILIGIVQGYGFNPRYLTHPGDTKLVKVRWVGHKHLGYVREHILEAI